jgi:type II secretory pathway predicted ATPase ExeA
MCPSQATPPGRLGDQTARLEEPRLTGTPGSGRSRAAAAVGHVYKELGRLAYGHLDETPAINLVGVTRAEAHALIAAATKRATGSVLRINDAHVWTGLPDGGLQVLWELCKKLTEYRDELRDELAVILAGQTEPLRRMLSAVPPMAARFRAVIHFAGYTTAQLVAIFATLAAEGGFTLTPEAEQAATALIAQAEADHPYGNARLVVRLLNQIISAQALRVTACSDAHDQATLSTIIEADMPEHLERNHPPSDQSRLGQYL